MTDSNGDLDTAKLLNKLQTLILRLDKDKSYRPPSVEAATDYLQEVGNNRNHALYYTFLSGFKVCMSLKVAFFLFNNLVLTLKFLPKLKLKKHCTILLP